MNLYVWEHYCEFEEKNVYTVLTQDEHNILALQFYNDELYCWNIYADGTKARLIKEIKI